MKVWIDRTVDNKTAMKIVEEEQDSSKVLSVGKGLNAFKFSSGWRAKIGQHLALVEKYDRSSQINSGALHGTKHLIPVFSDGSCRRFPLDILCELGP